MASKTIKNMGEWMEHYGCGKTPLNVTPSVNTQKSFHISQECWPQKQNMGFCECLIHLFCPTFKTFLVHKSLLRALKFPSTSRTILKSNLILNHKVACINSRCFPFTQKIGLHLEKQTKIKQTRQKTKTKHRKNC